MKKIILLFTLFLATLSFAQTANKAIAWSGIITDNSGNALANTSVTLKFSITQNGTPFFSEQHIKTTDANGFVNANIGEGTPLINNLSIVYFDTVDLKLKIEADSGSGFVTLSDEFFKAVPYAKGAETAREVADDVQYITLNNNIKFYVDGYQGEINQNGLKLVDLAGTGTREVVADANGQLQRKAVQTKYLSISGSVFNVPNFSFNTSAANGLYNNTGSTISNIKYYVPVYLPHGAVAKNYKVIFKDNSSSNFFADFKAVSNSIVSPSNIQLFNSNSTSASIAQQIVEFNLNHTVDNDFFSYYIDLSSVSWPTGTDLGLKRIIITYEE